MAEEESFTFVDKRRAPAESLGQTPAEAVPGQTPLETVQAGGEADGSEFDSGMDAALAGGVAPSTYDLIGYCINLLSSQSWQKLGLLADPQTGEAKPDLVEAKVAIDAVGDLAARLETAPEAVISADMRRDLRTLLNDLRLNYISQRGPTA